MKRNNLVVRIFAFILAVLSLLPFTGSYTEVAATSPKQETRTFIEWTRVRKYSDLPRDNKQEYYMFIAWDADKGDPNDCGVDDTKLCCITPNQKSNKEIQGCYYKGSGYASVFPIDMDKFITSSTYGMPRIWYDSDDGDNNNNPQYFIKLDSGNGSYVLSDGFDDFKFRTGEKRRWGIAVQEAGTSKNGYENSCKYDGCVCFYDNISGGWDIGFEFVDDYIATNKDPAYDDYSSFMMWIGRKKTYTVITENFSIMPGNTFCAKDGLVIDKGVTITVYPGAVFSVEGSVINNGTITNCGTIVLQDGSAMFPLVTGGNYVGDKDVGYSSGNSIWCCGSFDSITVPGYKKQIRCEGNIFNNGGALGFGYGAGMLYLDKGSTFQNRGFLISGATFFVSNATVVNSGKIFIGYYVNNLSKILSYKTKTISATVKYNVYYVISDDSYVKNENGGVMYFHGSKSTKY